MLTGENLIVSSTNATDNVGNPINFSKTFFSGGLGVAPTVSAVAVQTYNSIKLTFNESMGEGVLSASNYSVSGSGKNNLLINPSSIASVSGNTYLLTWSSGTGWGHNNNSKKCEGLCWK